MPEIGQTISHYRLVEKIGSGGMGVVYKAEDTKLKRAVALKFLAESISGDSKALERFRREAQTSSALNHPGICTIYDIDESEGRAFIAMELLEGQTLKLRVTRSLAVDEMLDLAIQIADALEAAHAKGIIHRDIKPANIFITKRGQSKILDFGLAKFSSEQHGSAETTLTAEESLTRSDAVVGTIAYMSPEQARGEELDARSDIFSFGVVLYEMATGRQAFAGNTSAVIFEAILNKIPISPVRLNRDIPEELEHIIQRCLEKEKNLRYQSISDMRSELQRLKSKRSLEFREKYDAGAGAVVGASPAWFLALLKRRWGVTLALCVILLLSIVAAIPTLRIAVWSGFAEKAPTKTETARARSLAVLPFANLSGDKENEYFSDGLTEEIINTLTQLPDLQVAARTSSFFFRGKEGDIREIGARLNVENVLEGSVRKSDNRIRITVQLISVADGYHVWSERYDREMTDIFAIQDEISQAIADKLRIKLGSAGPGIKRYTENVEAYNLYLKARYYGQKFTPESMDKSKKYYEQAIAVDGKYALAWSGLAGFYYNLGYLGYMPPKAANAQAGKAILKALDLDASLAEAQSMSAVLYAGDYDWKSAEEKFRKAMELDPKSQDVLNDYVYFYLVPMGRLDEAIAHAQKVLALDPLSPFLQWRLGVWYYLKRQWNPAIDQFQKALQLDPQYLYAHIFLGLVYVQIGNQGEAIRHVESAAQLVGDSPSAVQLRSWIYALTGRGNESRKLLGELHGIARTAYVSPWGFAWIYLGLGEADQCFEWLNKAVEEREGMALFLHLYPFMDPLRPDPRYHALLRKMNL
ncbi:MAG: protein kinase [Acidobacteria bacterium]|nr:protein kinase [Acidobacteriota bacterium]